MHKSSKMFDVKKKGCSKSGSILMIATQVWKFLNSSELLIETVIS